MTFLMRLDEERESGRAEGFADGMDQGVERGISQMILSMLRSKMPVGKIAEVSKWSAEKIEALAKGAAIQQTTDIHSMMECLFMKDGTFTIVCFYD